jgi:hypothetical protein
MNKKFQIKKKRGTAMIEMVLILPVMLALTLILWQEYNFIYLRNQGIQTNHLDLWQTVDKRDDEVYTVSTSSNSIANSLVSNVDSAFFSTLTQEAMDLTGVSGLAGDIFEFLDMFGLNQQGKCKMRTQVDITFWEGSVIQGLLNLGSAPDTLSFDFTESLLTDPWDSTNPGDTTSGQIVDRVAGGWLGPVGALGGIADMISTVLGIVGIDVPRVNTSAVPDASSP